MVRAMRVRASTLVRAYRDCEVEKRFVYRWRRKGYPPIKVVWDVPRTPENERIVKEMLEAYDPEDPFIALLRVLRGGEG